ncbi:VanZ family protein [Thermocatellispora tengchongensis]|uniref:VanZ family protein n=1 Tax=Thermocatellispora tengchongensis TaxID=1073253 RepID=UPI0036274136
MITAGALCVPLAYLAVRLLARRRAARGHRAPLRTATADVIMVVGTVPWLWMILTPRPGPGGVSVVPFQDLALLADAPLHTVFVQVGGNLLVFAALGALLPVRSARFASFAAVSAAGIAGSFTVEALQYALRLGRVSSFDDILLNWVGIALAAGISRPWWITRIPARTVPQ